MTQHEIIEVAKEQPTPSQSDGERAKAEQQYTITAFDYVKNPVGSYEWCIYWKGWQGCAALSKPQPTSQDAERLRECLSNPDIAIMFMKDPHGDANPSANGWVEYNTEIQIIEAIDAIIKESK